jgi:hypothetical protein
MDKHMKLLHLMILVFVTVLFGELSVGWSAEAADSASTEQDAPIGPMKKSKKVKTGKKCPYEDCHRTKENSGKYRMPTSGPELCNMCRRRLIVWTDSVELNAEEGEKYAYFLNPKLILTKADSAATKKWKKRIASGIKPVMMKDLSDLNSHPLLLKFKKTKNKQQNIQEVLRASLTWSILNQQIADPNLRQELYESFYPSTRETESDAHDNVADTESSYGDEMDEEGDGELPLGPERIDLSILSMDPSDAAGVLDPATYFLGLSSDLDPSDLDLSET